MTEKTLKINYPEEIVSVSGSQTPGGEYHYVATRRDGSFRRALTSRRRYKWFHQWRCFTASDDLKIIHYFSSKERAAPVPAWVPGKAERLAPIAIVYV
jgi:hypothetical protein